MTNAMRLPTRNPSDRSWRAFGLRTNWIVHAGLILAVTGTFLPWTSVATRSRSGFGTAELLLSVASFGAPGVFLALGAIWYLAAAATIAGWALETLGTSRATRRLGVLSISSAAVGWLIFAAWAQADNRLEVTGGGWILTFAGTAIVAIAIWRKT